MEIVTGKDPSEEEDLSSYMACREEDSDDHQEDDITTRGVNSENSPPNIVRDSGCLLADGWVCCG